MPSLVISNAAMVRLIWTKDGAQYAVNVLGALNTGPATFNQALATSLGAAIKADFGTSGFASRVSTDIALATVGIRSLDTANLPELTDGGAPVAGSAVADPLPAQVALAITLRTALAGPSYRGRVYLGGFAEDANDEAGACATAFAQDAVDFVLEIMGSMTANGLTMAVLSRPRELTVIPAKTIPAKAGFATPVTTAVFRDRLWDTQRRRLAAGI